jgi:outer membrane protein, heavy metal efflux system
MNRYFFMFVAVMLPISICGQSEIQQLSLNDAIETGLKNNHRLKSALENISLAAGKFWSGISLPQPEIALSYEYVPLQSGLNNFNERTLEARQAFEFPTNYFLRGNKLSKEEEIAVYKYKLTQAGIIRQIKTSYYNVLAGQFKLKSAAENLAISDDFYRKAEIRQNIGEGTNLEILTAKVQYTEARNNLESTKNELAIAFTELNYALGLGKEYDAANFVLIDSLLFIDYRINTDQIYASLDETHPQIKIAGLNYSIAAVEKTLAWSSAFPTFTIAYFRQAREGDTDFYGASCGISVPLWFMFEQRGRIQEATANLSVQESAGKFTRNEIRLNLKTVLADYDNNLRQVKFYVYDILPQAEEIYRTAVKSYDAGELTYLEYLQAKQTLINSQNNYIQALFNYYQSVFLIEELSGQNITHQSETEN